MKRVYAGVLLVLAVDEFMAAFGLVPHVWDGMARLLASDGVTVNAALLFGQFALLALFARPTRREIAFILGLGVLSAPAFVLSVPSALWDKTDFAVRVIAGLPGFGIAGLAVIGIRMRDAARDRDQTASLLAACALVPILFCAATSSLLLTQALHPTTLDLYLYKFEASLGFQASKALGMVVQSWPLLEMSVKFAYAVLPYVVALLFALQLIQRRPVPANIILVQIACTIVAWTLFQFFPATGPRYAFGSQYPFSLPDPDAVSMSWMPVAYGPRNAMPSMHFGWAFALWLNSLYLEGRLARAMCAIMLGLNIVATLGLGEHYLIDLIVSVPCVVAVQAACLRNVPWSDPHRLRVVVVGASLVLAWLLLLRYGLELFETVPGLSWAAILATLGGSIAVYRPLHRIAGARDVVAPRLEPIAWRRPVSIGAKVAGLFVISGFAGLAYQVLFTKALSLTFGSTSTAAYTVLATYMAGMALGAWAGGLLASRRSDALSLYAACELAIGLYCLCTPFIFDAIKGIYVSLAADVAPDASGLVVLRFALGALALLPPTVLMGMTLPVLTRFFEQRRQSIGVSVAWLYGANTLGAALGALAAGYAILPVLGMSRATLTAVVLNLIAAYLGLRLAKTMTKREPAEAAGHADGAPVQSWRLPGWVILLVLTVGGFVTLALEVQYTHLLAIVAGNSVYAFSLMLFSFLLGLGLGSEVTRRVLRSSVKPVHLFIAFECGLAVAIGVGIWYWDGLPAYFASFSGSRMVRGFEARELIRGLVCMIAMVPPAFFIGALYPIVMDAASYSTTRPRVAALGRAAALNTVGNILGVVVGGFLLLPYLGALMSLKLLAAVSLGLAAIVQWSAAGTRGGVSWAGIAVCGALIVLAPNAFNLNALASGANVYFASQNFGHMIDHAESVDGGLTSVAETIVGDTRTLTLVTNGKFQGNNSLHGEVKAQVGFSVTPLLHTTARDAALVIGYGTGTSAKVIHDAGFRQTDIVELSGDIIRIANQYFADLNGQVSEAPGVHTYLTDGRNYLLLQNRRYDVISMELTSIWFAGAASLYNREFYELARQRLSDDGVLQQWLQLHHITPLDLLYILGSVRSTFRYVWLYELGDQGIIVASNSERSLARQTGVRVLNAAAGLKPYLALYGGDAQAIVDAELVSPEGVDACLKELASADLGLVSTDDNLFLEYSTPKGNALDGALSMRVNLKFLGDCAAGRLLPKAPAR